MAGLALPPLSAARRGPQPVDNQPRPINSGLALPDWNPKKFRIGFRTPSPPPTGTLQSRPQVGAPLVNNQPQPANVEAQHQTPQTTRVVQPPPPPKKARTNDTYYKCRFHVGGEDCMQSEKEGLKNAAGLRNHMQSVHNLFEHRNEPWPKCVFCDKQFINKKKLDAHHDGRFKKVNLCWGDDGGKGRRHWALYPETKQERADTWAYEKDGKVSARFRLGSDDSDERAAEPAEDGRKRQRTGDAPRREEEVVKIAERPAKRRRRDATVDTLPRSGGHLLQGIGLHDHTPNTTGDLRYAPTNPSKFFGIPIDLTQDAETAPRRSALLQRGRAPQGISEDNPICLL